MTSETLYLVTDCYPQVGSPAFQRFTGAIVGCWVRTDVCGGGTNADAFVVDKLSAAGWTVARTLIREEVSAATYASKSEGREFFEQAGLDGFVANFQVRKRESIGEGDLSEKTVGEVLVNLAETIGRSGGVSFFLNRDQQWANGVTADGDEFVPLWANGNDAVGWLQHWPDYEMRNVTPEDLRCSSFLDRVNAADMWIALGVGKSLLTTCHPVWVREVVAQHSSP